MLVEVGMGVLLMALCCSVHVKGMIGHDGVRKYCGMEDLVLEMQEIGQVAVLTQWSG